MSQTARSKAVIRRTYNRPTDGGMETWHDTCARATTLHHSNLWAHVGTVNPDELKELMALQLSRKASLAGRTLWLGGTELSKKRQCSQFNCSFNASTTVYDVVDSFWLLLNGCGNGFKPQSGTLRGFNHPIQNVTIVGGNNDPAFRGREGNAETVKDGVWTIGIGDSAEAWAKSIGKLLAPPDSRINELVLDFSEIRGAGERLSGYGWICNGWSPLRTAFQNIIGVLNTKSGDLLDEIDILDVHNHLGTVLSSRRSAEIAMMDYGAPRWREFADAKQHCYEEGFKHRQQSNNSLIFWHKPSKKDLRQLMQDIWDNGGSEPGFVNGEAARRKAPWFVGFNPCAEILLPNRGFCNLVEVCLPAFGRNIAELERAIHIISRANYRQTCVNLDDGILSKEWHQTNESLRLCGVGLTGIQQASSITDYQIKRLRNAAVMGAYSMADELGLPRPKLVTTIKPSGTLSKIMDCTEGVHKPLGKYIFNWINFSKHDPMVQILESSGYKVIDSPVDAAAVLICFPVAYDNVRFGRTEDGRAVNSDTAVDQLKQYRRWNTLWADHNVSNTISWDISEIDEIVEWLHYHWNDFVAVSWLRRADPTLRAADLGFNYLPQEVVTREEYEAYAATLTDVDFEVDATASAEYELDVEGCVGGVCPVK